MTDHDYDKTVERVEDLRREYCPEDDPEWSERRARRETREDYMTDEPWKDPSNWEGPEPGRCGSCGQFVEDGAIICHSCDVAERRREFEAMLP